MPVLETTLLGKFYPLPDEKRVVAVRGVSLRLEAGEALLVVGPRGAGKTTLLNLLAGLERPTRGTLYWGGKEVNNTPRWQLDALRSRQVGVVPPHPQLLPELSVLDNVALPVRTLPGREQRSGRARAAELLASVGLAGKARALPRDLTPAERQRAVIARAFVNRPLFVVADEPACGLPEPEARALYELLRTLAGQCGAALVLAVEDPAAAPAGLPVLRLPEEGITPLAAPGAIPADAPLRPGEILGDTYEAELEPLSRPLAPLIKYVLRPAAFVLAVAVLITYLCFFGLELAGRGRAEVPLQVFRVAGSSVGQTVRFLGNALHGDLGTIRQYGYYYWNEAKTVQVRDIVRDTASRSLPLLGAAILLAAVAGSALGVGAALARRSRFSLGFIALSVAGVSVPSFFLAFLLQYAEINFYRLTGIQLVPIGGFAWDRHIILPMLVLAARPIAQVARVSYVSLTEVLDADYIRTARAKGLNTAEILVRHALKNAAVPILTTLGASLRFALSSLPIVETIFSWPGIGPKLFQAISSSQLELAASLALTLGLSFTVVNIVLDNVNHLVDPRLGGERTSLGPARSWWDMVNAAWAGLIGLPAKVAGLLRRGRAVLRPLRSVARTARPEPTPEERKRDAAIRRERRRAWLHHTLGSGAFTLGALIIVALIVIVVWGPALAPRDPFAQVTTQTAADGRILRAPFAPSAQFLLGTDLQGRDILSLILVGARRTMTIALFAVLVRVLLGALLGCLAGWFAGSLLDRALMSIIEVLAAFPALLFAMVVIYALGVKQGLWVFVVGLSVTGWGEAAQYVRNQVMTIREKEYVEGALAVGLGDMQILLRQALPNLFPSLVVLAFLEMGGVMMLLGELGFLGVFIGGGAQTTNMLDQTVTYFDVPEWGVMLSSSWRSFRTYPWATLYPALAFTIATLGFNFFGEGLRRLTERLTVNLNRIFNRYTVGAAVAVAVIGILAAEGSGPWGRYKPIADRFDGKAALADVQALTAPEMNGRRTGDEGLTLAADYIAGQFRAMGMMPAGEVVGTEYTYFQTASEDYHDLTELPALTVKESGGADLGAFTYGQDIVEYAGPAYQPGSATAEMVYASGNWQGSTLFSMPEWVSGTFGRVVLLDGYPMYLGYAPVKAILVIATPAMMARHDLQIEREPSTAQHDVPMLFISEEAADRILAASGHTLAELRARRRGLEISEGVVVPTDATASVNVSLTESKDVPVRNVIGMIPGEDTSLDAEAVFVVAHYDGLGRWADGTYLPGANDNASGVGVLLETARLIKESGFTPKRTIFFLAWQGAERRQELDLNKVLSVRIGYAESYRVAAIIEVNGVGAGSGKGLVVSGATSSRMEALLREAVRRTGGTTVTKGHGVHENTPLLVYSGANDQGRINKRLPYIGLSWDGSTDTEHLPTDTFETIDVKKLALTGRAVSLALMRITGESKY